MSEADLRRAICRFPPTMMDPTRKYCRQCSRELKKMSDFRQHILKHADIPQFRCRFCTTESNAKFTAHKREQMFQVKKFNIFIFYIQFTPFLAYSK